MGFSFILKRNTGKKTSNAQEVKGRRLRGRTPEQGKLFAGKRGSKMARKGKL